MTRTVGIFLFNNIEVLDFAGPFEVFTTASRLCERSGTGIPFQVFTFAKSEGVITARGGLKIIPDCSLENVPKMDVLLIPGGVVDEPLNQPDVLNFIKEQHSQTEIIASVCTGALILAKANLLRGLKATTHWEDLAELSKYKNIEVLSDVQFVDAGQIITSAGIASGITMSLYLVERLAGQELAIKTARQMEYPIFSITT